LSFTAPATPEQSGGRLANFRLIPRIDTYPRVIALAQTDAGKIVLLTLFGLGLAYSKQAWLALSLWLMLTTFLPDRRRILVTAGALNFAFLVPLKGLHTAVLIASVLVLGGILFWSAGFWPRSWYGRRPVFFFLSGFAVLILFASSIPGTARYYQLVWDFTAILSAYIWFIGYSLLDRKAPDCDSFGLQLGTYRPFWGSTNTPFPKGAAYLRRIEARDAGQLAVAQLKGLKLLAWSILISLFARLFARYVYGYLAIPTFAQALSLSVNRTPLPAYICWASLIANFFGSIISTSIWGHTTIACCRMAGFNALRNTYRPLSSRTVAEFFNRYYFYFKELLVDFFFYPMFLRYFKKSGKFRLVAAIFAAACFGNAFYHFVRDLDFIQNLGLMRALVGDQVYVFLLHRSRRRHQHFAVAPPGPCADGIYSGTALAILLRRALLLPSGYFWIH
jgi:hypothetical protein